MTRLILFLFAWYSVDAASHSQIDAKKVGIGTYANNYSAGGVSFTATLGDPSNDAVTLSDDNGRTFYTVVADGDTEDTQSTLASKYGTCTVKVDAANTGSSQASLEDRLKSLAGNTVTVTITAKMFAASEDTSVDNNKTYYSQDGTSHLWTAVASPTGNPSTSGYFEVVANAVKLKNASSIQAHAENAYRAVDNGWANEAVAYHTDIKISPASGLTSETIAQQTFVYGIDGQYVTDVVAKANNYIQIEATVTFAETGA